jgi:hypothetical protein
MQNFDRRPDDWVSLTSIASHNGSMNETASDKVVMVLYNISRENIVSTYATTKAGSDSFAVLQPPVYIDLHIMFMANFSSKNYLEGLEAISLIISFFQQNPYFTQANAPDFGPDIDKISMEMSNLDTSELNHVMGMLGTKYLPSVFYKLRMLPFGPTTMQRRTYPIRGGGIAEAPDRGTPS